MESASFSNYPEERQNRSLEDSDDKLDSSNIKKIPRARLIRKNNHKSKAKKIQKPELTTVEQTQGFNVTTPFGIYQSEMQKCQRVEHYLKKDIDNFYKTQINEQDHKQLNSYISQNFVHLKQIVQGDIQQIWTANQPSVSEIWSYLQMINLIEQTGNKFQVIHNEKNGAKYFCCQVEGKSSYSVFQISNFQVDLLEARGQFMQMFQNLRTNYSQQRSSSNKTMSQIKRQIIFMYKKLCQSSLKLQQNIKRLKQIIQQTKRKQDQQIIHENVQNQYITAIIKKLLRYSLAYKQIDYLNLFKDNQIIEQGFTPQSIKINDQRQFQQFMKKKKNKKGKKARYALHSGCLGCLNFYYEIYNPLIYCHQCYVRFHKYCYKQYSIVDDSTLKKQNYCETCYNKKMSVNTKLKSNQCEVCGIKGLLSLQYRNSKHIHVFCALLNGLWKIQNQCLEFDEQKQKCNRKSEIYQKCQLCQTVSSYIHKCSNCNKNAHVSCAYLNGWQMGVQFNSNNSSVMINSSNTNKQQITVSLRCCGQNINTNQNEKRRKFITNFKKEAYSSI